ncbi:MAG: toll/interleukin-1 receptor domain-containing protein [Leptolyngbya sp. SIO3F4]|nr:toll/interleukin-1 receptor domain-containing protein [Leptolyngbya sp. SIO3F4]
MEFEQDLFISFTHIDNRSLTSDQEGWISTFHKALQIRLSQLLGYDPKIWRDRKLQGNDHLSDAIIGTLSSSRLLVSILSPRYLRSEWCMRELKHFSEVAAEQTGGIRVGDSKSRLFKVVKTYLPKEQHPAEFTEFLGYEFYEFDDAGRPQEFDKIYGPELERKFYAKLNDLAYDICQTLSILAALSENNQTQPAINSLVSYPADEQVADKQPVNQTDSGKTIYLAETTFDLHEVRDNIRRELTMAGHQVLPTQALPFTPDFAQQVQENLAQCVMSIHLVSPQGTGTQGAKASSSQALQNLLAVRSQEQIEIASHCCQEQQDISRILWMPPTQHGGNGDPFIEKLQRQPDFISTPLEVLKTIIEDRLIQPASVAEPDMNGTKKVYLDCDQRDLNAAEIEPLYEWLDQKFEVVLPDYEDISLRQSEVVLKQCQGVLIYYGQANGLWLKRRLNALKKSLYDRPQPLLSKALYVAGPERSNKQSITASDMPVIDGLQAFNPGLLEPFLAPLMGGT